MADFNVDLQAPQGAGASVVAPVRSNFGIPEIVGDIVDVFNKGLVQSRKSEAEAFKNSVVGEYTRRNAALDDAISQGLSPSQARVRRQALFAEFSAAHPEYVEDYNKVAKAFKETGAVGEVLDAEQAKTTQFRQLVSDAASKSGIPVSLNDPIEVQQSAVRAHQMAIAADEELRRATATFSLDRAKNEEERTQFKQNTQLATNNLLAQLGSANLDVFAARVEDGVSIARAGGDISPALNASREHLLKIKQQANNLTRLNPEMYSAFISMYEDYHKILEAAPTAEKERTEDAVKQLVAKRQFLMMSNSPEYLNLVAASRGAPSVPLDGKAVKIIDNVLKMTVKPVADSTVASSPENQSGAFEAYKAWRTQADKNGDPKASKEADNLGASLTKSMSIAGSVEGMNADQFRGFVNWVASPEFRTMRQSGKLDEQTIVDAKNAHTQFYAKPTMLALQNKMNEEFTLSPQPVAGRPFHTVTPSASFADLVDLRVAGDVVVAEPKPSTQDIRDKNRLTKELEGAVKNLNTFLKAGANIDNYPDVKTYWEDQKHVIFPQIYPDPRKLKVGDTVKARNGKSYKYLGGNFNDIENSYMEVKGAE